MKWLRQFIREIVYIHKNDPVKKCELFRDKGCSHVDGYLCDFPNCSMNSNYLKSKENQK